MPTLITRIDLSIGATLSSALGLSSETRAALSMAKAFSLSSGTATGQADQAWWAARNIVASGNDDLDLAGGLTNGLNQTVTFVELKSMFVFSKPANLNPIHIGGGAAPLVNWVGAGGDIVRVLPGGFHWLYAPGDPAYVVTPTTADILRITNGAGGSAVDYEIVLFGTTA